MNNIYLVILIIILGLVALFTFQNPDMVTVRFLSFEWNTSKLVMIVTSFAAGVLAGWLVSLTEYFRKRRQTTEAKKTAIAGQPNQENQANLEAEATEMIREMKEEVENLKEKIEQMRLNICSPSEPPNPEETD